MGEVKLPPPLAPDAHKGDAGRLFVLAGSAAFPGAALLCVEGALRGGAGLVTLGAFEPSLAGALVARRPEATLLDLSQSSDLVTGHLPREIASHRHQGRVAGPGLGAGSLTRQLVRCLLEDSFQGPLVLDADALNVAAPFLEQGRNYPGSLFLTPHPGEGARLFGKAIPKEEAGRIEAAGELARRAGAICILKGAGSVVSDGERSWICRAGNPGMATGGTGDVLAGLLGAYALRIGPEFSPFEAACAATWVHARAGDRAAQTLGRFGMLAGDLALEIAAVQRSEESR